MKTVLNKVNKNLSKVVFYKEQGVSCCRPKENATPEN